MGSSEVNTNTAFADAPVGYNPFIHGTTSATLVIMPKTNFQLMPVLKMLDDYQAAPIVGELTQGGYNFLGLKLVQEEGIGATSFGKLQTGHYNLKKITANYTHFNPPTCDDVLQHFKHELKYSLASGFSRFNLLLIYFTRARQMHLSLDQIITKEELDTLNQQLQATIQFYYFIQLLGTYIHTNFDAINEALAQSNDLNKKDITDAVYSLLDFKQIIKKIMLHEIDMKSIVLNPSDENLRKALELLNLPKKATIKSGNSFVDKEIELPVTQFFSLKKTAKSSLESYNRFKDSYQHDHFGYFSQNVSGYGINNYLEKFLSGKIDSDFFIDLSADALQYVVGFEDRIRVFNKLINTPQHQFQISHEQQDLLTSTYPIVFVSESSNIQSYSSGEYRSKAPLKLGDDILMVATDTDKHRNHLQKYLRHHHVDPVQVILFSDLEKAANDKSALPVSIDSAQLRMMLTKTKNSKHSALFYELYALLDDLNDKRNKFRQSNSSAYKAVDLLLYQIDDEMNDAFSADKPITSAAIRSFCSKSKDAINEQKSILEHHRGLMGVVDSILTLLVSFIVLYPIVYLYQKTNGIQYTFFNTDSGIRAQNTMEKLNQIDDVAHEFSMD